MSRRFWALLAVLTAVAGAPVASAAAPPDALRLSVDGVSWASSIGVPLFDPAHVWVPGDTETVQFWAENNTSEHASLTVDFGGSDVQTLLDAAGVSLTATADGTARTITIDDDARLVDVGDVEPHERIRIALTFTFAASAGNDTQRASVPLTLVVTLSQAEPGTGTPGTTLPPPTEPPPPAAPGVTAPPPTVVPPPSVVPSPTAAPPTTPGPIPATGIAVVSLLAAATLVLVVGVGLSRVRRTRRAR